MSRNIIMLLNTIFMPLHVIIMPLNSIIIPLNIIIMLLNIIFMLLHIIIMPLNSIIMPLHIIIMPLNSIIMPRVSPAYGYIKSALVKCSNEGGLGPRFNMKGDHGSSIFNRQVVYYLNLLTSSRKQMTGRINGYPFPPFQPSWAEPPSLPPGVCTPPPSTSTPGGQPLRKHTSASGTRSEAMGWARGG